MKLKISRSRIIKVNASHFTTLIYLSLEIILSPEISPPKLSYLTNIDWSYMVNIFPEYLFCQHDVRGYHLYLTEEICI